MTTVNLLWWVALLGGAELTLQGHLGDRVVWLHGGAWLVIVALVVAAWQAHGWRRLAFAGAAGIPLVISLFAVLGLPAATPDPLAALWDGREAERKLLFQRSEGRTLALFGQNVALDTHGFRVQPQLPASSYRIVAIGGSNTFGVPRPEDGPPWPELLQREIEALGCAVPVAVFNAGRTGRGVAAATRGFDREIASLRPDLLIVYPGPADLFGLGRAVPAEIGIVDPLPPRASSLLARLELELRVAGVERRFRRVLAEEPPSLEPKDVPLARSYRALLVKARKRGIDVALATASLAVNGDSPEATIRRYEALESATRHAVLANRIHGGLALQVGASFRAIRLDTRQGLDGSGADGFLDLFHLSRQGRERLARRLLEGLRPKLSSLPRPGCPPV